MVGHGNYYSPEMARYVADFLENAKKQYGIDIAYTGIWNEKKFDAAYVKELRRVLNERHLPTNIVCCDQYPGEGFGQWNIADAMHDDPVLKAAVDVIWSALLARRRKVHNSGFRTQFGQAAVVE